MVLIRAGLNGRLSQDACQCKLSICVFDAGDEEDAVFIMCLRWPANAAVSQTVSSELAFKVFNVCSYDVAPHVQL